MKLRPFAKLATSTGIMVAALLTMSAGARAQQSVTKMAAALEDGGKLLVEAILPLSGMAPGTEPLAFYQQVVVGTEGSVYLSAMSGGRYRAVPYRVLAFNSDGRLRAGLEPKSDASAVAFLLGTFDEELYVVSRGLGSDAALDGTPWYLYKLSTQDLSVRSERAGVWPGVLVGDEIVAAGIGSRELERTAGYCVHVHGLDGLLRRSMAKCPDVGQPALNGVESGSDGTNIYWVHSSEGLVRVVSLAGEEGVPFGGPPAQFVSYSDAYARARARAPADAPAPTRSDLIDEITRVTRVLAVGNSLFVTYFLPPLDESKFWERGSIVQIYDLTSKALKNEFETPLRLLGADVDGRTFWIASVTGANDTVRHAIVRTATRGKK